MRTPAPTVPVPLADVVAYLDGYLRLADGPPEPEAFNGLQVEGRASVSHVAGAVDACQATIDRAARCGADLLLVHHGLLWGRPEPLVGRHGRRMAALFRREISLYAAHLPLDLHPEVGNNAVLARALALEDCEPFGSYQGTRIGVAGTVDLSRAAFVARVAEVVGRQPFVIPTGPDRVRRVGIVSGAAGGMIDQAHQAGLDTFLTGEGRHHSYFDAEEWALNVIYAGHYATETLGVRALGEHLAATFGLPFTFIDHPTGL